jgi:tRNA dimethylallyltransferase
MAMDPAKRKLIVIGGPTASGKSALALAVAEQVQGTVVNADSMQVYDGLSILTNRPDVEEQARAPHRLFGVIPPEEACSAGRWQAMAVAACTEAWHARRIPVVVGGTGLYLRALIEGIAPVPDVPEDVRQATRALCREIGTPALHAKLAVRDPAMAAKLRPSDSQRLMRAWEVLEATGRSLSAWQDAPREGGVAAAHHAIFVAPPRAELYAACDRRFTAMIEKGALDEVRALLARKLDPDLPVMKSLGVRELAAHLADDLSLSEAIAKAQTATRHYAKRQFTWFRHQWSPDQTLTAQFSERSGNEIFTKIREFLLTGG